MSFQSLKISCPVTDWELTEKAGPALQLGPAEGLSEAMLDALGPWVLLPEGNQWETSAEST